MGTLLRSILYSLLAVVTTVGFGFGWTSATYLSYGVARSICVGQRKFVETGTLVAPFKRRLKGLPEKCVWLKKDDNCNPAEGSSCLPFAKQTCAELGIVQQKNRKFNIAPLIIGGRDVEPPNKYPSFAVMMVKDDPIEGGNEYFPCGAVIVSESWALTAAHCTLPYEAGDNTFVLAARYNLSKPENGTEQMRKVVQLIKYPNITQGEREIVVDLALFRVDPPFEFNENISAAKLANKLYDKGEFTLVGHGYTNLDPVEGKDVPQEVEIPTITRVRCRELVEAGLNTSGPVPVEDHNICFSKEGGGAGGCYGDSGGPAYKIENGEQIMVATTEGGLDDKCEQDGAISVYVEVFNFLSWIEENIGKSTTK